MSDGSRASCRRTLQPEQQNLVLSTLLGQTPPPRGGRSHQHREVGNLPPFRRFRISRLAGLPVSPSPVPAPGLGRTPPGSGRRLELRGGRGGSHLRHPSRTHGQLDPSPPFPEPEVPVPQWSRGRCTDHVGGPALNPLHTASFQFSYLSLLAIGLCVFPVQPWIRTLRRTTSSLFLPRVTVQATTRARMGRRIRYRLENLLEPLPRTLSQSLFPWLGRGTGIGPFAGLVHALHPTVHPCLSPSTTPTSGAGPIGCPTWFWCPASPSSSWGPSCCWSPFGSPRETSCRGLWGRWPT